MDTLTLQSRSADPYVVLRASGELDLHTQDVFEEVVSRHLSMSSVVVDFSGVEFLSASAIGSLVQCHSEAGSRGHELFYAEASQQALRLLVVAGLADVLPLCDSVAQLVCRSTSGGTALGGFPHQSLGDLAQLDVG